MERNKSPSNGPLEMLRRSISAVGEREALVTTVCMWMAKPTYGHSEGQKADSLAVLKTVEKCCITTHKIAGKSVTLHIIRTPRSTAAPSQNSLQELTNVSQAVELFSKSAPGK